MTSVTKGPEEGEPKPTTSEAVAAADEKEANDATLSSSEEEEDLAELQASDSDIVDASLDDEDAPIIHDDSAPSIDDEDVEEIANSGSAEDEEEAAGLEVSDKEKDQEHNRPKERKKTFEVKSRKSSSKPERGDKEGRRSSQTGSSSKEKHHSRRRSPKASDKEKHAKQRRPKREEQPLSLPDNEPQDSPSNTKEKRSSSDPYLGPSTANGKSRRRSLKTESLEGLPKPITGKLRRAASTGSQLPPSKDEEERSRPRRSESSDKNKLTKKSRPKLPPNRRRSLETGSEQSTRSSRTASSSKSHGNELQESLSAEAEEETPRPQRSKSGSKEELPKMSRPKPLNGRRSGSAGLLPEQPERSKRASRTSAEGKSLRRTKSIEDGASRRPHLARSLSIREEVEEPERTRRSSRRTISGGGDVPESSKRAMRSSLSHHSSGEPEEPRIRRGSRHDPHGADHHHKAERSKRLSRSLSVEGPVPSRELSRRGSRRSLKLEEHAASEHSKRGGRSSITPRTRLRRQNTHDGTCPATAANVRVSMSAVEARRRKSTIRRQQSVDETSFPPAATGGRRTLTRRNTSDNIGLRQLQRGFALQDARVQKEEKEIEDQRRQREMQEKEEEMLKLNAEIEEARKRQQQEEQDQAQGEDGNTLMGLFSLAQVGNNATDQMAHAMEQAAQSAAARAQLARAKAQQALTGVFGNIGHLSEHGEQTTTNNNHFAGNKKATANSAFGAQHTSSHGNNDGTTKTANWAKFPSMT